MIWVMTARRLNRYSNPEGKGSLPAGLAVRRRDRLAGQKPFSKVTREPRPCLGSGPNTRQLSWPGALWHESRIALPREKRRIDRLFGYLHGERSLCHSGPLLQMLWASKSNMGAGPVMETCFATTC